MGEVWPIAVATNRCPATDQILTRTMRANKFPFTDKRVERIEAKRSRESFYDSKCPGLELRVSETGYKVFYLIGKRGRRKRIGQFPTLSVKIAREVANEKRLTIELRIPPVQRETLLDAWEKYREDLAKRECTKDTFRRYDSYFAKLKAWHALRLEEISQEMVTDYQGKVMRKTGAGSANDSLKMLRALVNFAAKRGWKGISPTLGIREYRIQSRTRFVEPQELPRFVAALEERKDVFSDLILVALFTGVRRSGIEKARWADIDLERRVWRCVSKGKRVSRIYFSDYVLDIFRRRRIIARAGSEFVFENPFNEKPLGWVRRVMYRAEMAARGLPVDTVYLKVKNEFSLHTMRHTFITYALQAGVPLQVLESMVGHALPKSVTVRVYGHSIETWERDGFKKVADLILSLARESGPKERTLADWNSSGDEKLSLREPTRARLDGAVERASPTLSEQKISVLKYFRGRGWEKSGAEVSESIFDGVSNEIKRG